MKDLEMYPGHRLNMNTQGNIAGLRDISKCNIDDIEEVSSEIVLRKRISLTLLTAFLPFIGALYLIASNIDVNKSYFIALASIYTAYYLVYSIWACTSHCPSCGKTMSKRYHFIMPSLTCSHCGHDLKHPNHRH